jgi:hypothetical protein
MREQRETLDRRTYNMELRAGDELLPHHVLPIDGRLYTVEYLQRTWGSGGDEATVELAELKDAGTDGLSRGYSMDSESGGAGGGDGGGRTQIIESQTIHQPLLS